MLDSVPSDLPLSGFVLPSKKALKRDDSASVSTKASGPQADCPALPWLCGVTPLGRAESPRPPFCPLGSLHTSSVTAVLGHCGFPA